MTFSGIYVTIPIMQFALLFLSLERLSSHFNLSMTCLKIFTKPYLIQVILCIIWITLLALLATLMFIRKQFSFNFLKDKVNSVAPPIIGDVADKIVSRRRHCSIDGRLSSIFKTLIIVLFVILIVKPILISLGFNLLTPIYCRTKRKDMERRGDRRTTTLVTMFILLNLFFSFPFYFTSMFKSILTNIDSIKDTFTIVLKTCFILRITNIIFECLAFYIFERNSWSLISKLFYYGTCKKFPIFNEKLDDDVMYTKNLSVQEILNRTRHISDEDDDNDHRKEIQQKRRTKQEIKRAKENESDGDKYSSDDDHDGAFRKASGKYILKRTETPKASDNNKDEKIDSHRKKYSSKTIESGPDKDDDAKHIRHTERTALIEKVDNDDDDDKARKRKTNVKIRKYKRNQHESSSDKDEENDTKLVSTTTKDQSTRSKAFVNDHDEEKRESTINVKRKSHRKTEDKEEIVIEKPKLRSTETSHNVVNDRLPNGRSRQPFSTNTHKTRKSIQRHSTPPRRKTRHLLTQLSASSDETKSHTESDENRPSSKMINHSISSKPIKNQTTKRHSSPGEHKASRTVPRDRSHSRHHTESTSFNHSRAKPTTSTNRHHTTQVDNPNTSMPTKKTHIKRKKARKDLQTRIFEMSDEV